MKDIFLIFAKYNKEADGEVLSLLGNLSNEERESDRGSYYGSLSGLARHILGGTHFFLSAFFKEALNDNTATHVAAREILKPLDDFPNFEGTLTEAQWKAAADAIVTVDDVYVKLSAVLTNEDYAKQIPVAWYGGNPASVPLSFLAQNLVAHNIHHRGQISQILDSLKIEHNFSGLNPACLADKTS
ncbi:MAG: damage-inducible protein DinB [Treponema sp.]|nr:damage-inducible protein DinB [Treponema sp.]